MPLRIEKVLAHVVEMPSGFTYSRGIPQQMMRAVIWEVIAGAHVGLGEGAFPLEIHDRRMPALSAGACDKLGERLAERGIASALVGECPFRLEALLPDMPREFDWEFLVLREGLSIALYDLVGKAHGVPVHVLLGGKRRDAAPGMPVIHTGTAEVMIRRARAWVADGYRYLKIKPPAVVEESGATLLGIREAVGPDISLQVDANQIYDDPDTAERAMRALDPVRVEVFEDMLNGSLEEIAELRRRTGACIMVDHEATWPRVHEVCKVGAAAIINHHPNNQGGLATALQIDAVAAAAGVPSAIGSSGRFGIQDAAFQMLSLVIGTSRPCEDIGHVPYFSGPTKGEYAFDGEPSVIRKSYPIVNGVIHVPDEPGLGVELDRERLKAVTVDTLCFE